MGTYLCRVEHMHDPASALAECTMILIHIRHLMKYKHVSTHIELMAHGAVTLLEAVIRHSLWAHSNLIAIANVEPYSSSRSRDIVPSEN